MGWDIGGLEGIMDDVPSPNIPLVSAGVGQLLDKSLCLRPAASLSSLDQRDERLVDVSCHGLGIAADVKYRFLLRKQLPYLRSLPLDMVLHNRHRVKQLECR